MTESDHLLRARLTALEASVPASASPAPVTLRTARSWWRRLSVGLVLAAVALGTLTAVAISSQDPVVTAADDARSAAEELAFFAAYDAMSHPPCPTVADAKATAQAIFDQLGLAWTVRDDGRYRDSPCVGMGASGETKEVLLMPGMGRVVAEGLDRLKVEMVETCLARDVAIETVASFLRGAGIDDPDVRVGGMLIVPAVAELEALLRGRLADGCYVYNNAQFDEHGRYTWFIAGP